jgi:hypothetical protein
MKPFADSWSGESPDREDRPNILSGGVKIGDERIDLRKMI